MHLILNLSLVAGVQLAPFPFDLTLRELRRYPKAEVMWVQVRLGTWTVPIGRLPRPRCAPRPL